MTRIVDLVIPVYNEAPSIGPLFNALDPLKQKGIIRHIIIGDNNSTDDSDHLAHQRGAVVVYEKKRGYGAACLAAIRWIETQADPPPDAIAFLDADLADDPEHLQTLINALDEHDLALGSRRNLAEKDALNPTQRLGGIIAATAIFLVTGHRYHDLGPMRVVRFDAYKKLNMKDKTWGWTVEMQLKAAIAKMRIKELPVPYRKRLHGKSKISGTIIGTIRAGVRILWTIFIIRLTWESPGNQSPEST